MFIFPHPVIVTRPGQYDHYIVGAAHGFRKPSRLSQARQSDFTLLLIFVCFGLSATIAQHPLFSNISTLPAPYLSCTGYKIASSRPDLSLQQADTQVSFRGFNAVVQPESLDGLRIRAALFSNPSTNTTVSVFIMIYFVVCYLSLASWAVIGDRVSMLLRSRQRIRTFNLLMGSLLIVTAGYMLCMPLLRHS